MADLATAFVLFIFTLVSLCFFVLVPYLGDWRFIQWQRRLYTRVRCSLQRHTAWSCLRLSFPLCTCTARSRDICLYSWTVQNTAQPAITFTALILHAGRLYILCWRELSRRKLSPTLATPTTLVLTTLVARCELSRRKIGLLLEVVGRKFSHRPGNPATVGVVRWPAAGDTAGSSLRQLSSLQHRIYNLLDCT